MVLRRWKGTDGVYTSREMMDRKKNRPSSKHTGGKWQLHPCCTTGRKMWGGDALDYGCYFVHERGGKVYTRKEKRVSEQGLKGTSTQ